MNMNETIPNLSKTDLKEFLASQVSYGDTDYAVADIPIGAILYALDYGLDKSRQDSVAGWNKALTDNDPNHIACKWREKNAKGESVERVIELRQEERRKAMWENTLGERGPRLRGRDAMVFDVAQGMLKTIIDSGKAVDFTKSNPDLAVLSEMPKGKVADVRKVLSPYVELMKSNPTVMAKINAKVDAEIARLEAERASKKADVADVADALGL